MYVYCSALHWTFYHNLKDARQVCSIFASLAKGTAIRKQIINDVVENPVSTIENNLNQLIDWFQVLHGQANGVI